MKNAVVVPCHVRRESLFVKPEEHSPTCYQARDPICRRAQPNINRARESWSTARRNARRESLSTEVHGPMKMSGAGACLVQRSTARWNSRCESLSKEEHSPMKTPGARTCKQLPCPPQCRNGMSCLASIGHKANCQLPAKVGPSVSELQHVLPRQVL